MELGRIHKLSDQLLGVDLKGKALATVAFTTVLCHLQMHDECSKNYAMEIELVEFRCTCKCHDKQPKREGKLRKDRSRKGML